MSAMRVQKRRLSAKPADVNGCAPGLGAIAASSTRHPSVELPTIESGTMSRSNIGIMSKLEGKA